MQKRLSNPNHYHAKINAFMRRRRKLVKDSQNRKERKEISKENAGTKKSISQMSLLFILRLKESYEKF